MANQDDAIRTTNERDAMEKKNEERAVEPHWSILSEFEKRAYAYAASIAAMASPVASTIYYPALNLLAKDLNTSLSNINLTITTYLIFQALAPTIIGGFSDRHGRRPAYFVSFLIFIAANTALALQTSYPALLVLRMVQSSGSSGTIALSNGVVSDVSTRGERGSYIGLAALGQSLGPALGPLIGGLLTEFLGWRAIFWFLDIYAGVVLLLFIILIPETCRNIVGNGSIPPQKWNYPLISYLFPRLVPSSRAKDTDIVPIKKKSRPSIFSSIPILLNPQIAFLLFPGGLFYAGFYIILTGLPSQLTSTYNFNAIQVGLCYIPVGAGSIASKQIIGRIIDFNFRRHAKRLGIEIHSKKQTNLETFPVEYARLEVAIPLVWISCATIIPYGWVMTLSNPPLAAVIILLFLNTMATSGSFQAMTVLVADLYPTQAAAATAANNLVRCLMGAGGVAAVIPLLNRIGRGWTAVLVAAVWAFGSACWWIVMVRGWGWREAKREKEERAKIEREMGEAGVSAAVVTDGSIAEKPDIENREVGVLVSNGIGPEVHDTDRTLPGKDNTEKKADGIV